MKILGIVPARGGSKRLPGKNIADLGGQPLIKWSIDVGVETCAHVVVSTDDGDIKRMSVACGSWVVTRPARLAGDDSPSEPAIAHAVEEMRWLFPQETWDAVLVLQPTSPFRTADDVRGAVDVMERTGADTVISVVSFPKRDTLFTVGHAGRLRPVENGHVWTPNGAIYLIKMDHLLGGGEWYGDHAYSCVMPPERSLDIDTHADLDAARAMLADGRFSPATNKKIAAPAV